MLVKVLKIFTGIAAVVVGAALLWSTLQTQKANRLVSEANAANDAATALLAEVGPKFDSLTLQENVEGFPKNRDAYVPVAKEIATAFEKAAEQYRIAASKFDEASKDIIDDKEIFEKYWGLKKDAFAHLADSKLGFRKVATAWTDESVNDAMTLIARINGAIEEGQKHSKAFHAAQDESEKLEADNKAKFKDVSK
jgi:hypothetical protein